MTFHSAPGEAGGAGGGNGDGGDGGGGGGDGDGEGEGEGEGEGVGGVRPTVMSTTPEDLNGFPGAEVTG